MNHTAEYLLSLSGNTRRAYKSDLAVLQSFLGSAPLTPASLLSFRTEQVNAGVSPSTVARRISAAKAYTKWAEVMGYVQAGSFAALQAVAAPKQIQAVRDTLTEEEELALLDSFSLTESNSSRDYTAVLLLLDTALRVSELTALNVEDLRFDSEGGWTTINGKGNKQRRVFWGHQTSSALITYLSTRGNPSTGPLFVSQRGTRLTARYFQLLLEQKSQELGFEIHPHKLRRTTATRILNASGDLGGVADLLGHANINTTRIYARGATNYLRKLSRAGRVENTVELVYTSPEELVRQE